MEMVFKGTENPHSGSYAKLQSNYVGVDLGFFGKIGSTAPGYISFGTPWVYAVTTVSKCDGGTYGGREFWYRPDAISGWFKRTDTNEEVSHIIFYSWKGTFKSKIGEKGNPKEVESDVDRAIMARDNASLADGNNGTLIAKVDYNFTSTDKAWKEIFVPLEYVSGDYPEKFNVVLSCADYWTRDNMKEGTELHVDDVRLVYYSRMDKFSWGGETHDLSGATFTNGVANQTIDLGWLDEVPTEAQVRAAVSFLGASGSGKVNSVSIDDKGVAQESTITVVVGNKNADLNGATAADVTDADGLTTHTYKFTYKRRPTPVMTSVNVGGTEFAVSGDVIATALPYTAGLTITPTVNSAEGSTVGSIVRNDGVNPPTVTVTVHNDNAGEGKKDKSYTLTFLPYKAELTGITAGGTHIANPNSTTVVAKPYTADFAVIGAEYAATSGAPAISAPSAPDWGGTDPKAPRVKVTVSNGTFATRDYYFTFWPVSAEIKSLSFNGVVATQENGVWSVDAPMPADGSGISVTGIDGISGSVSIKSATAVTGEAAYTVTTVNSLKASETATYKVAFLPYSAKLAAITVGGKTYSEPGTVLTLNDVVYSPDIAISATADTHCSGAPTVSVSPTTVWNGNVPQRTITVANGSQSATYTVNFAAADVKLTEILVNGAAVDLREGVHDYTVDSDMPASASAITATVMSNGVSDNTNYTVSEVPDEAKYRIVATNPLNDKITRTYTLSFHPYSATVKRVLVAGQPATVSGLGSDAWTIDLPRPDAAADLTFEYEPCSGTPSAEFSIPTGAVNTINVTFKNHTYTRPVTITFLPYSAELDMVTLANGKEIHFAHDSGASTSEEAGVRYNEGVKPVSGAARSASGNVTVAFSGPDDLNEPKVTVTVTNTASGASNSYTLVYDHPFSSRLSGVTVGGTTYSVGADGTSIDATAHGMPMPAAGEITPVWFLPQEGQSVESVVAETESGKVLIKVKNTKGADIDGEQYHGYTVDFGSVSVSRPRSITILDLNGNPMTYREGEFDSKRTTYSVNGWMPMGNTAIVYAWFEGKELTADAPVRSGDEYSANPSMTISVRNPDGGKDYDGLTEHTYTFTFEQRPETYGSSSLSAIRVNGSPLGGFSRTVTDYSIDAPVPEASAIAWDIFSSSDEPDDATTVSAPEIDANQAIVKITVTNTAKTDASGVKTRTYTLRFTPYHSRLQSISANGERFDVFNATDLNLIIPGQMPDESGITLEKPAKTSGTITTSITLDRQAAEAKVKVSNTRPDTDGLAERTYTLHFAKPYFSRLEAIEIGGQELAGFSSDKYEYTVSGQMPANVKVEPHTIDGGSGNPTIAAPVIDRENATITITVSNTAADIDGESTHTYIIRYDAPFFSRIESLKAGQTTATGITHNDDYTLTVHSQLPQTDDAVKALLDITLRSGSGAPETAFAIDRVNATVTLTVTNGGNADTDGKTAHIYKVQFDLPYLARLSYARRDGIMLAGFDPAVTEYTLEGQLPAESAFTFGVDTKSSGAVAVSSKTHDKVAATMTVTVTNDGDGNAENARSTTYVFRYATPYFSQLSSLKVGGAEVVLKHDGSVISVPAQMPASAAGIVATARESSGTPTVEVTEFDTDNSRVTVTVSNDGGEDPQLGGFSREYILQFVAPYRSTAASISLDGREIHGFSPEVTDYTLSGQMPAESAVTAVASPGSGTTSVSITADKATAPVTVTVSNDGDGEAAHASSTVYTLHFDLPYFSRLASLSVNGTAVTLRHDGEPIAVAMQMPATADAITATAMPGSGTVTVSNPVLDADARTATITVTNPDGTDPDFGGNTRTYILHFAAPYSSAAAGVSFGGTAVPDFNPAVTDYTVAGQMPAEADVTVTPGESSGLTTVSKTSDPETGTMTVTLTNDGDGDPAKASTTTYTFHFDPPFFSRLAGLSVSGTPVSGFARDT